MAVSRYNTAYRFSNLRTAKPAQAQSPYSYKSHPRAAFGVGDGEAVTVGDAVGVGLGGATGVAVAVGVGTGNGPQPATPHTAQTHAGSSTNGLRFPW